MNSQQFFDSSMWTNRIYSGGWIPGGAGSADVIEPATGRTIGQAGIADVTDVARATALAVDAQRGWAETPYDEKARILRHAGDLITAHAETLVDWLIREAGSGRGKAEYEAHLVAAEFYSAAAIVQAPYGQLLQTSRPRLSFSRRIPVGVVGVIAPFNFPQVLASRSVAPALAAGNAVILKPDPRTSVSGGLFLAAVLEAAGLPDGLMHVLAGGAEVGAALVDAPETRVISFTGSTRAGRFVGEAAARGLKRAHLELGGNNALIVLEDVDVAAAVSAGAWGSFLHQGQICMTTGRHIVHESIYDEYVERLSAIADGLPVGNTSMTEAPLGPVIDSVQRDHVNELVLRSVASGARLAAGGTYEDLFYRPTVLADCSLDSPAFAEEVFGPVAPVIPFSTPEEAVAIASRSEYGLSLGILTRDVMRGLDVAGRIPSGIVHINDQTVDDESVAPFGGVGASGTGARFGGADANLDAFSETQWVTVQGEIARYPFG